MPAIVCSTFTQFSLVDVCMSDVKVTPRILSSGIWTTQSTGNLTEARIEPPFSTCEVDALAECATEVLSREAEAVEVKGFRAQFPRPKSFVLPLFTLALVQAQNSSIILHALRMSV